MKQTTLKALLAAIVATTRDMSPNPEKGICESYIMYTGRYKKMANLAIPIPAEIFMRRYSHPSIQLPVPVSIIYDCNLGRLDIIVILLDRKYFPDPKGLKMVAQAEQGENA